jgi:DNA-binding NarL/FixJ family response regulator
MDIEMPGVSGIEAVKMIKNQYPKIEIVMQTVFEDDERVFQSICAGASGYLLKSTISEKLLDALEELRLGGAPISPNIALKVLHKMKDLTNIETISIHDDYKLSAREKEVLALIVKGLNHKKISEQLFISYETVRSHVKKIYEKLHVASKVEAVNKAVNEKLV